VSRNDRPRPAPGREVEATRKNRIENPNEDRTGNRTENLATNWIENRAFGELLLWAMANYPDLLMTSGFNLNGVVLLDLAVRAGYRGEVVFVDTGRHFRETLETRDRVAERYPQVEVVTLRPAEGDLPECGAHDCCARRKLAPLRTHLEQRQPDALLTARSRFQSDTRASLPLVEPGGAHGLDRVNPLAYCSLGELESHARRHRLPVNPLYFRGYLSIGCEPATRAVRRGEAVRAGRWDGQGRIECGLWQGEEML
jgi:phosphoadenosine phosphosulfate reductase